MPMAHTVMAVAADSHCTSPVMLILIVSYTEASVNKIKNALHNKIIPQIALEIIEYL